MLISFIFSSIADQGFSTQALKPCSWARSRTAVLLFIATVSCKRNEHIFASLLRSRLHQLPIHLLPSPDLHTSWPDNGMHYAFCWEDWRPANFQKTINCYLVLSFTQTFSLSSPYPTISFIFLSESSPLFFSFSPTIAIISKIGSGWPLLHAPFPFAFSPCRKSSRFVVPFSVGVFLFSVVEDVFHRTQHASKRAILFLDTGSLCRLSLSCNRPFPCRSHSRIRRHFLFTTFGNQQVSNTWIF